eukprot:TRINITY_DN10360_c0_g1_i1.p1 TRINITY_DN10360_c0_g1~~TRINITY_DN10360_c0_g1_i1.p1  ORF type:complete len:141 (+),score=4.46 TRINITY_DN10360_c0_g1_i1:65-487(+)
MCVFMSGRFHSFIFFFFLMIRRPPRSTLSSSSAASDVYKRQISVSAISRFEIEMQSKSKRSRHTKADSCRIPRSFRAFTLACPCSASAPTELNDCHAQEMPGSAHAGEDGLMITKCPCTRSHHQPVCSAAAGYHSRPCPS